MVTVLSPADVDPPAGGFSQWRLFLDKDSFEDGVGNTIRRPGMCLLCSVD